MARRQPCGSVGFFIAPEHTGHIDRLAWAPDYRGYLHPQFGGVSTHDLLNRVRRRVTGRATPGTGRCPPSGVAGELTVTGRTYGFYDPLAQALDDTGERWALLVVRELLDGPRRYGELQQRLPGLSTARLADRLRELRAAGLIEDGYALTEQGRRLAPAIYALTRFGLARLRPLAAPRPSTGPPSPRSRCVLVPTPPPRWRTGSCRSLGSTRSRSAPSTTPQAASRPGLVNRAARHRTSSPPTRSPPCPWRPGPGRWPRRLSAAISCSRRLLTRVPDGGRRTGYVDSS